MIPLPEQKFKTIVIDPPWPVSQGQTEVPYKTMPISSIASLPIRQLTEKNCYVFLWTTNNMMEEAFGLLRLWRLKYVQTITWCKNYGMGRPPYTATEHVLMSRIGQPPRNHSDLTGEDRIFNWFKTDNKPKHSQKPDEGFKLIEQVSEPSRLEMFARKPREGWITWGDEC